MTDIDDKTTHHYSLKEKENDKISTDLFIQILVDIQDGKSTDFSQNRLHQFNKITKSKMFFLLNMMNVFYYHIYIMFK